MAVRRSINPVVTEKARRTIVAATLFMLILVTNATQMLKPSDTDAEGQMGELTTI